MNPEEQKQPQTPEEMNPTAYTYLNKSDEKTGKKTFTIIVIIALGIIMIAALAVFAYYSNGDRTEENIDELGNELDVSEDAINPPPPSAE